MNEKNPTINNFILNGISFFSMDFDDIHRLIAANKKKIIAAIRKNLILENNEIKKICENPKASNHK
jgi:hypothetical protein